MDAIDHAILDHLQSNGRMPNSELAERIGLSASACLRRVQALEASGIIRGYAAVLDEAALGFGITVIVHITLDSQSGRALDAFEKAVEKCPNVVVCYLMSGTSDYILRVVARDLADFERLHRDHLSAMPGVSRIQSAFTLRRVIERTPPTPAEARARRKS